MKSPRILFGYKVLDLAAQFRAADKHNRVCSPVEDVWISAITESASTLGDTQMSSYRARDPLSNAPIVKCDPNCTDVRCVTAQRIVRSFGRSATHCSGCTECWLMDTEVQP